MRRCLSTMMKNMEIEKLALMFYLSSRASLPLASSVPHFFLQTSSMVKLGCFG